MSLLKVLGLLGVCYIISTTSHTREGGHKGGNRHLYSLHRAQQGSHIGNAAPLSRNFKGIILYEVLGNTPRKKNIGPYIRLVDLPIFLCMGFTHGFGHDVFPPMVFCRSS